MHRGLLLKNEYVFGTLYLTVHLLFPLFVNSIQPQLILQIEKRTRANLNCNFVPAFVKFNTNLDVFISDLPRPPTTCSTSIKIQLLFL